MTRPAVVLVSGGLDSTTVLALAQAEGYAVHALTFDYGQRHHCELAAAERVARAMRVVEHRRLKIDLRAFGGSALTGDLPVPHDRDLSATEIPATYVPARNTIFLSFALAYAEVCGAADIFIGVNALDYSGYPDCRPEYIAAFQRLANLATRAGVEGRKLTVHTPLIALTKAQIIKLGMRHKVDYALTHSCYDPLPQCLPCGSCDACRLRRKGFAQAGVSDPLPYPPLEP
ncbi:7-cyano-7-deazaguanine synthase QueC [bacterium]|nr:7-cyano-7-deazaguanine synthase QueC [bacterium]